MHFDLSPCCLVFRKLKHKMLKSFQLFLSTDALALHNQTPDDWLPFQGIWMTGAEHPKDLTGDFPTNLMCQEPCNLSLHAMMCQRKWQREVVTEITEKKPWVSTIRMAFFRRGICWKGIKYKYKHGTVQSLEESQSEDASISILQQALSSWKKKYPD